MTNDGSDKTRVEMSPLVTDACTVGVATGGPAVGSCGGSTGERTIENVVLRWSLEGERGREGGEGERGRGGGRERGREGGREGECNLCD